MISGKQLMLAKPVNPTEIGKPDARERIGVILNENDMENMRELSNYELESINGGLGFLATVAAGIIVGSAIAVINDWDNFKAGLKGEQEIE